MSLVGTRPPTVDEWEKYELHHRSRMSIKPGITGMWQASGRSDITDFEEVVKLDTEYIENWSIGLDGLITDAIIADNYLQEQIYLRAFWLKPDTEILRFGFPQNDVIERDKNNSAKIDCLRSTLSSHIYCIVLDSSIYFFSPDKNDYVHNVFLTCYFG